MKINTRLLFTILIAILASINLEVFAQEIATLPLYHKENISSSQDWLLGNIHEKSDLYKTSEGSLV
ncbi:hypothetical protein [Algoriphagus aquimarinus]|uniref:Uncharacterized protein n=1 Tax=Algoriphagus aquimarinus TaxID=237018 RepID=A0A1I1BPS3_9BACT|nr:hypothetical protein [Algoriphagus aquimarinus]SFB52281.1 hypothetical protein SAMN04489723_11622 [Algoriphagus aquimarinus]